MLAISVAARYGKETKGPMTPVDPYFASNREA